MEEADGPVFVEEFTAQGWHPDPAVYQRRLEDQAEGKCIALTAVCQGHPAGSVYVYLTAKEGPFKGKGWPIIVDFNVLKKFQRKGIGSKLMDIAEPGRRTSRWIRKRAADVYQAGIYSGRNGRLVSGQAMRSVCDNLHRG